LADGYQQDAESQGSNPLWAMMTLNHLSPDCLTPEDRLQEIAFILAHGLLRLRLSGQPGKPPENEGLLDFLPNQSVHDNPL